MLNEKTIEKLTERLVSRVENANSYVLKTIGEQITRVGKLNPTTVRQLSNLLKYGNDYDKIVSELMRVTKLNIQDIETIFEEVAKSDYMFAKEFYQYRNMDYIPYDKNVELQAFVKSMSGKAVDDYLNLSQTLGFRKVVNGKVEYSHLRDTYLNTIDDAVLSLSQGQTTFQSEMKRTVKELGQSGVRTVDFESGYSRRLDSSVRMNIKDSMLTLHNELQTRIGGEIGADGIEISVHENPAKDHEHIQGKQYSIKEFEALNNNLDRPISTMNCYHYIFSIILGVSKPRYSEEELKEINRKNKEGFTYQDIKYTNYEGTQLLRRIETEVRKQKDIQALGNKEATAESKTKVRHLMKEYRNISKASGLSTRVERLSVFKV